MKAIITVVGQDRVGIIAAISKILAECNINIQDITQTIMQDMFTMTMFVDISKMSTSFNDIRQKLEEKGRDMRLDIRIQHENIFKSMHRI